MIMDPRHMNSTGYQADTLVSCDSNRTLIVDDEVELVRLFTLILSSALPDVKIDSASNGAEALNVFDRGHHGVLLMDLHMPVMDGEVAFSEIEKMCQSKGWRMPAVVFCTAYAPPDAVQSALAGNTKHCLLSKPMTGSALVTTIQSRLT